MPSAPSLLFPPFRLDIADEQLWRGSEAIFLRRKTFAVLRYLAEHPGQLVTKESLFDAVWPAIVVSKRVLTECIRELRNALADDHEAPGFVETVHGRGYRFIAPVTTAQPVQSQEQSRVRILKQSGLQTPDSGLQDSLLVGRDTEIAQLHQWLHTALSGERQLVFVTGEPGIGKTTVVDAFLHQAARKERLWIARGQCIEHYSASEAYLPVLEALGRLCREPDGARLVAILRQHAPLWLAQLPSVLEAPEREALQRQVMGATPERMLREMAQAIEELTVEQPLVLWLEDLHGSDYATLDLLAFLARRREPARLLVVGTYRPLAVRTREHPLYAIQQELQVRGQCHELALEPLGEGAVAEYVTARFAVGAIHESPLREVAHVIHQRTEGNPLFMVSTVETLLGQEALNTGAEPGALQGLIEAVRRTMPANIRQFIEQQVEYLRPEEQQLLEAVSVGGMECSAAALAAGLGERTEEVEERCAAFARRGHFVRVSESEEWPDGTVAARYRFVHALYQEVLYERVTTARRLSLHQRIGERVDRGYGARASEVAVELAMHFERGRDYGRAVRYLHMAGETAMRRHAYREAVAFFTKGIALLQTLPETAERRQHELALHVALGPVLSITRGFADPEVKRVYTRARELCQQVGETPQLFSVLQGLWIFSFIRAEHQAAHELGEQLLRLAQSARDPALLVAAHYALGTTLCFLGEFAAAQEHAEQGTALYDPQQHPALALLYGEDSGMHCLIAGAWVLWFRGYPDQALAQADAAITLARKLAHPFNLEMALFCRALLSQHCLRLRQVEEWTEEAVALSSAHGFPFWLAGGLVLRGAMLAQRGQSEGGIEQMRQGLAAYQATGAEVLRTYFLALLADAYGAGGRPEEGLAVLEDALVTMNKTVERFYKAELHRLRGQLTLQSQSRLRPVKGSQGKSKGKNPQPAIGNPQLEAEACFQQAIAIARGQGAKSLELRAVMSLSRLWQQQGKQKQAQKLLTEIYGRFTEGFGTADLQEAKALLGELS